MVAFDPDQPATDSADIWLYYSAFGYCDRSDNFFTIEDPPQIPFYDTPQGAIFSGSSHKKVQIKQRILEYRAKY